jgi:hypothetical protein
MAPGSPVGAPAAPGRYVDMHRCAAGRSCRDPVTEDGQRRPATIAEPYGLCDRCRAQVAAAIDDLERDYGALQAAVTADETRGAHEHVSGTPSPPIPLNTTAEALARSMAEWAEAAVGVVAAALGIDAPVAQRRRGYPRRDAQVITAAARIVGPNLDALLEAPEAPVTVWDRAGATRRVDDIDGIGIGLRLVWCHRQVIALADPNPRQRLAMPCPVLDCGAPTLGVSNGSTDVTCTSCGGRWSEREYAWLAGLLVSDITKEDEEATMLEWLLAEQQWKSAVLEWLLAERDWKLRHMSTWAIDREITVAQLRKVGAFTAADLGDASAADIVALVRELVA